VTRKRDEKVRLPGAVTEEGYPDGYGPAWVSEALGVPGCLADVTRYLSDDGEETALVLRFSNKREQIFRPARLVTTRRLTETLGALGFPVPYYQPPQLALLGQALGRIADRAQLQEEESSFIDLCSVVSSWAMDCLEQKPAFALRGRAGRDVRAAIEHVRINRTGTLAPLIFEPDRNVLLAWTAPLREAIRDQLGSTGDGVIGVALQRGGLVRERIAARPVGERKTTHEMPVWVVYNGWMGVELANPHGDWDCGPFKATPLESVRDLLHARAGGRTHTVRNERSTTPNAPQSP
jgi:hypothetical protein